MQSTHSEKRREPVRTTLTLEIFVSAMVAAWSSAWGRISAPFVAMVWAKYIAETSNKHCYNWNIGNVKDVPGDGFDYHCLRGVLEGVTKERADALVASGQVSLSQNEQQKLDVYPLVAVIYEPPHPATRFRSYDSLAQAMPAHLEFLRRKYPAAFEVAHKGDVAAFVRALSGYMTANATRYTQAMSPAFASAMKVVPSLLEKALVAPEVYYEEPMPIVHGTHVVEATLAAREAEER